MIEVIFIRKYIQGNLDICGLRRLNWLSQSASTKALKMLIAQFFLMKWVSTF